MKGDNEVVKNARRPGANPTQPPYPNECVTAARMEDAPGPIQDRNKPNTSVRITSVPVAEAASTLLARHWQKRIL